MCEFPDWANCTTSFENVDVQVFADTLIEDQPASCHIDFANKHDLHKYAPTKCKG